VVVVRHERLRLIAELARSVSSALDLDAILDQVTAVVAALRRDIGCVIRLVDHDMGGYRLAARGGAVAEGFSPVLAFGEGLTHAVVHGRRPVLVEHAPSDSRAATQSWKAARDLVVYYGVPIEAGDEVLGVLSVLFPTGGPPSEEDRDTIDLLAGHAAVAIRNARLFAESEGRRQAAESLADIGRVVTQTLDLDLVAHHIAHSASALLRARSSALYRLEPNGDLVGLAVSGDPGYGAAIVFPRGTGTAGLAVRERRLTTTADVVADPRVTLTPELRTLLAQSSDRAVLAVPLVVQDRVIGAFAVRDRTGRVWAAKEIWLAQAFADQAALALENARLYTEAARRRREAEELARIARVLTESLDVQTVGERIVESVLPLFGVLSSGLYRLEADGSLRAVASGGRAREHFAVDEVFPAGGIMGRTVAAGAAVWCRDVLTETNLVLPDAVRRANIETGHHAVLAVPLRVTGRLIGVLAIADGAVREFAEDEIALLQAFADQAAVAIENAQLYRAAQDAYQELSRAQAQLVRGETLRALGELTSGTAHHLNNLLAVVSGRIQLLLRQVPSPEIRRPLEIIERAATDSAEVIRRLRAFSVGHPISAVTSIDLNEVAQDVLELTRSRWQDEPAGRGIRIDAVLESEPTALVAADGAALREVLVNLVLNAVDAMPNGGRITVKTWTTGEWIHCSVSDTGIGMSPEVRRRALEPFFTTKGVKSTGLGLSVNYGILHSHGGDLTIDSDERCGTTVTVRLPLRTDQEPAASVST
jgi:GAF domain-containing protein/anti-sigma regulatory factor (Ser/Thr protein kinase)